MKKLASLFLFICALTSAAFATQLTGTLQKPDGTGFTGTLYLSIAQQVGISSTGTCGGPVLVVPTAVVAISISNGVPVGSWPSVYGGDCTLPQSMPYNAILKDSNGNTMFTTQWLITGTTQDVGTVYQGPANIPPTAFNAIYGVGTPDTNNLNPCSAQSMYVQQDAAAGSNLWPCINNIFTQQLGGSGGGVAITSPVTGGSNTAILYVNSLGQLSQDIANIGYNSSTQTFSATHISSPNIIGGSISGNSNTATALAGVPAICPTGQAAAGVDVHANALNCFTPAGGGGGVTPGNQFIIPFYNFSGTQPQVGPSNITTDSTQSNITLPGVLTSKYINNGGTVVSTSGASSGFPSAIAQANTETIYGPGWSLGNSGDWSTGSMTYNTMNNATRGIFGGLAMVINRHSVGDGSLIYGYLNYDGGSSAQSDEGETGATLHITENTGYFHATVSSTSGTGDTNPILAFTSGNNWTTDGAFLLDISKGTISGNLNGASVPYGSTFLKELPVTGVTLPLSTAIGVVSGPINWNLNTRDSPTPVTVTVTLQAIGAFTPQFNVGDVITIAGNFYPEQSIITAAPAAVGTSQSITFKSSNPNASALIFAGGIQGMFISFDANLALSGMRSSYYAFGSTTGSDMIYGVNVGGSVGGTALPQIGAEAATNTGANSGFHLYPGCEIVRNNSNGANPTCEQNGVHWAIGDAVENPHYPAIGSSGIWINKYAITPGSFIGAFIENGGPGFSGGANGLAIQNTNTGAWYAPFGPLEAPLAIAVTGVFSDGIVYSLMPSRSLFEIQGDFDTTNLNKDLIDLNWLPGGHFSYQIDGSEPGGTAAGHFEFSSPIRVFNGGYASAGGDGIGNGTPVVFTDTNGNNYTISGGIIVGTSVGAVAINGGTVTGATILGGQLSEIDLNMGVGTSPTTASGNVIFWSNIGTGAMKIGVSSGNPTALSIYDNNGPKAIFDVTALPLHVTATDVEWNNLPVLISSGAPAASTSLVDHSVPVVIGGTTYYVALKSTP